MSITKEDTTKKIYITLDQITSLSSNSTRTDLAKGKVAEYIAKEILIQLEVKEIHDITEEQKQLHLGDLLIIDKNGDRKTVEVKTSHQFNGVDKLAMDYKYFKEYDRRKREIIFYDQENTENELGWLWHDRADILIAINQKSCKAYIINNFSVVAANVLADVEAYINSLEEGLITFYRKDYKNYINEFLEGSVKIDGYLKNSFIVNLELCDASITKYGGELQIIDIDLQVTLTLDEFKKLTQENNNLPRRRRERKAIIEEEDKKTTPSTVGSCKRRSRF